MRGIELIAKYKFCTHMFSSLLRHIDVKQYIWHIVEHDYLLQSNQTCDNEPQWGDIIDGNEFLTIVNNNDLCIFSTNIRAYPFGATISKLDTYEDYLKSDCFFMLLSYDIYFVEIYCKDIDLIMSIYADCNGNEEIEKCEYKSDDNDGRTILYVWGQQ